MKRKSIAKCIFLTIITLGIYGVFWVIDILWESDNYFPKNERFSPIWKVILSLVTGGLYGIFWWYRIGKYLHKANTKKIVDKSILYFFIKLVVFCGSLGALSFKIFNNSLLISYIPSDANTGSGIVVGISGILTLIMMILAQRDLNILANKRRK